MAVRHDAARAGTGSHRATQVFGQRPRLVSGARALSASAAMNEGKPSVQKHLGGAPDEGRVSGGACPAVLGMLPHGRLLSIPLLQQQILGNVDVNRAGPAGHGDTESVANSVRDPLPLADVDTPFDRRAEVRVLVQNLHSAHVRISYVRPPGRRDGDDRAPLVLRTENARN